ncbi:DUF1805 domain-containing protein [Bacillus mangrovi]|uniref:DUF1805 domain-containing protein n=2 Tax=Metabacillus mangrovi TaxID=1491830 RepID=A0A7X2S614_9BACI|nr:DUF1805 domain-containing protein [Metabacillus mangrovi]
MVTISPVVISGCMFTAVTVKLPKTDFMAISSEKGYIACGAVDINLFNEKLKERGIIAGRAVGVRSIDQLLNAPLESVTLEAEKYGIHPGMTGKDALLLMV